MNPARKTEHAPKEQFKLEAEALRDTAQQASDQLKALQERATFAVDFANRVIDHMDVFPTTSDWAEPTLAVRRYTNQFSTLDQEHLTPSILASALDFNAAQAGTAIINQFPQEPGLTESLHPQHPAAQDVLYKFDQLFTRAEKKDQLLNQMRQLGMAKSKGGQNIIRQVESAWEAFTHNHPTPTPSLIAMREAVNDTINLLVDKLPAPNQTDTPPILRIGDQAPATYTTPEDFQRLQADRVTLNNNLSNAKPGAVDRHSEVRLMGDAIRFLSELLNAVDPEKLLH